MESKHRAQALILKQELIKQREMYSLLLAKSESSVPVEVIHRVFDRYIIGPPMALETVLEKAASVLVFLKREFTDQDSASATDLVCLAPRTDYSKTPDSTITETTDSMIDPKEPRVLIQNIIDLLIDIQNLNQKTIVHTYNTELLLNLLLESGDSPDVAQIEIEVAEISAVCCLYVTKHGLESKMDLDCSEVGCGLQGCSEVVIKSLFGLVRFINSKQKLRLKNQETAGEGTGKTKDNLNIHERNAQKITSSDIDRLQDHECFRKETIMDIRLRQMSETLQKFEAANN